MPSDLGPAGPRDPLRAIYEREQRRPTRSRLFAALAAILVLGAFVIIIYYAYREGVRAGSESVAPLIKAEQQPYKVKPDEPGGMDVPNQDKLIYNEVLPKGSAEADKPVEHLLPPPEAPLPKPTPEAQPGTPPLQPGTEARPPGTPAYVPLPPAPVVIPPVGQTGKAPAAPPSAAAQVPATPVAPAPPVMVKPETKAASAPSSNGAKSAPQVASKPLGGAWRVQLGAVRSAEDAKREWGRLQKKAPAQLGHLTLDVRRVDLGSGKGVFFRIQAGPLPDRERANAICDKLKAEQIGCLAVRP